MELRRERIARNYSTYIIRRNARLAQVCELQITNDLMSNYRRDNDERHKSMENIIVLYLAPKDSFCRAHDIRIVINVAGAKGVKFLCLV